eukprot:257124-Rhodomonas_salina.1
MGEGVGSAGAEAAAARRGGAGAEESEMLERDCTRTASARCAVSGRQRAAGTEEVADTFIRANDRGHTGRRDTVSGLRDTVCASERAAQEGWRERSDREVRGGGEREWAAGVRAACVEGCSYCTGEREALSRCGETSYASDTRCETRDGVGYASDARCEALDARRVGSGATGERLPVEPRCQCPTTSHAIHSLGRQGPLRPPLPRKQKQQWQRKTRRRAGPSPGPEKPAAATNGQSSAAKSHARWEAAWRPRRREACGRGDRERSAGGREGGGRRAAERRGAPAHSPCKGDAPQI